jgi:hypothetical protein
MTLRPLLTVLETAQLLGCAPTSLITRSWRDRIGLPCVKLGRSLRFKPEDVERLIRERTEQPRSRKRV